MQKTKIPGLSKSRYLHGLQCPKYLWLETWRKELKNEVAESTEEILAQGHRVGALARELFPGGVEIPYEGLSIEEQLEQTQTALASHKVIYEASFQYNGVFIKADIIRKVRGGWELYEVKSSGELKATHYDDLAIQYHVISNAGIKITKAHLVHINTAYLRKGKLDPQQLFTIIDLTEDVLERQTSVKKQLAAMKKMLAGAEPEVQIGPYCYDPYECAFSEHCWQDVPEEGSVFDLAGKGADCYQLYHQGISKLVDIPLDLVKGKQRQQVEAAKKKQTIVNKEGLHEFLDSLWYPLCFLDFETFMEAVPSYDGQRPYQQIPFQFSLHIQKKPGGKLYHYEYLAEPGMDPRKEFLEELLEVLPDDGCIMVYNMSFEKDKLEKLAELFPRKKKRIQNVIDNMVDLIVPFRARHLYSWKQKGSHSLKAVLPAFVKGISYDDMEIGDGASAIQAYHTMCALVASPKKLATLRKQLLAYCKQDTLAMVRLLEVLSERAS